MAIFLGVDTGGTFTDAVLLDEGAQRVIASAKALTSRPDLAQGIGGAIDAVLAQVPALPPSGIAMVALSTTLATNALVEGQGAPAALVMIGFAPGDRDRAGLGEALAGDPLIEIAGGHNHAGSEERPLDHAALDAALTALPPGTSAVAVASRFATRNPAHEIAARSLIRARTGLPVTCSHELSAGLNGPKRALTALLNARLIAMIDRLVRACETHLSARGIAAPLMVVRGDGALVSAALVRERPIETILSGPAASIAGAAWLTGATEALVSDIGGTTTDVCLLRDGRPAIDPEGARVGGWRTMVEAVAMRTTGLGGDSELHVLAGLDAGLRLGPRRVMPLSLAAHLHPALVHRALDTALGREPAPDESWRIALPLFTALPPGLPPREAALAERLLAGPQRLTDLIHARVEAPALTRLVQRGLVLLSGPTPTDAAHVLDRQTGFDRDAAHKALTLLARQRGDNGERLAPDAEAMAYRIVDQLTRQTVDCLLETAFAEDDTPWAEPPETLARHSLTRTALHRRAAGLVRIEARLGVPVIGLGASAGCWYGAVGERLGCPVLVPDHAGVANAVGAVVGQVSMPVEGQVTSPAPGEFIAHLGSGPQRFGDPQAAVRALEDDLGQQARARAVAAGVEDPHLITTREDAGAEVEGQRVVIEIRLRVTASGRPRIATG
ncbi:MAG: hydantoinase/oxoprolinase family protein [Rhodobacter sp.]|uniref:hydantoinase/oxoprolinase family protein n=1 Tax=Pararhodobacter sp. TaxID=2127056 RepID=UPI002D1C2B8D|nr:hydantoinase/oxoprolinase family protein [Pararhodobacter sp.]MCC0074441.1 hydantoinase/oxoprolinase family protein [Rhodobacter sp.]HPD91421.1 hydantoinase/oxoprolinase family protein [Pararhodobacter sp.]